MSSHPGFPGSTIFFDGMPGVIRIHELKLPKGLVSIDQWISPSQFSAGAGKGDFPPFIIDKVFVPFAQKGKIVAWVADFSGCSNMAVYHHDTLEKIQMAVFPEFAKRGLKDFLVVLPPSKFENMLRKQVRGFSEMLTAHHIKPHICETCADAMKILQELGK